MLIKTIIGRPPASCCASSAAAPCNTDDLNQHAVTHRVEKSSHDEAELTRAHWKSTQYVRAVRSPLPILLRKAPHVMPLPESRRAIAAKCALVNTDRVANRNLRRISFVTYIPTSTTLRGAKETHAVERYGRTMFADRPSRALLHRINSAAHAPQMRFLREGLNPLQPRHVWL